MPNVWLGFATTYHAGRFAEGDALLIYDHAPNGRLENKEFAWFGPFNLTQAQIDAIRRNARAVTRKILKADISALSGPIAAYVAKAFDPTQYVAPNEIPVIDKTTFAALLRNK